MNIEHLSLSPQMRLNHAELEQKQVIWKKT